MIWKTNGKSIKATIILFLQISAQDNSTQISMLPLLGFPFPFLAVASLFLG